LEEAGEFIGRVVISWPTKWLLAGRGGRPFQVRLTDVASRNGCRGRGEGFPAIGMPCFEAAKSAISAMGRGWQGACNRDSVAEGLSSTERMVATDGIDPGIVRVEEHDQPLGECEAQGISETPRFSAGREEELFAILHDLNNVLVCVLLNARIMAQKLPSYSVLKRNLHEVERSAQQGGLFVRRLRNWIQDGKTSVVK